MTDKQILQLYLDRFRLECHFRMDMVPGDIAELPIFMYKAAQESVIGDMKKELDLDEEKLSLLNRATEFFIEKLIEKDHYGKAEDMLVRGIETDQFSK